MITKTINQLRNFSFLFFISLFFSTKAASENIQIFYESAANVYVYAYPLVMMDLNRQVMTNVSSAESNGRAPINQFSHVKQFATPQNKDVVRPNSDTLYSSAWLDLSKEPLILSVPNTDDRYYLLPLLDAWTDVIYSVGKRTTGTEAHHFLIVGPDWVGVAPDEMGVIRIPTNLAWITGRTLMKDIAEYDVVHQIQNGYRLTPLSAWGTKYVPPSNLPIDPTIDMKTVPYEQVDSMDAEKFFTAFTKALIKNPPHQIDFAILEDLKKIRITPGEVFDKNRYTTAELHELDRAVRNNLRKIKAFILTGDHKSTNGWISATHSGQYHTDYLPRAAMAYYGIGANIPEDSIYPITYFDIEKNLLNGANRYVIHFDRKNIPPVQGFWSVTLYGKDGYLVENSINRYTLGDRSPLKLNPDGSLDIYIQYDSPGLDKESNWLPAPMDEFNLTMRLYWPKARILKGLWHPPEVKRQTQ